MSDPAPLTPDEKDLVRAARRHRRRREPLSHAEARALRRYMAIAQANRRKRLEATPSCASCSSRTGILADEGDVWTCSSCGDEWPLEATS